MLYVAGKQGTPSAFTEDSAIFRIEYTSNAAPYAGPTGRIADACFTDGVSSGGDGSPPLHAWENPFARPTCFPPGGPCPGAPDGTACGGGDGCHASSVCKAGACAALADGTSCADGDPCNGGETCVGGSCVRTRAPGTLALASLTAGAGGLAVHGTIRPSVPLVPDTGDDLALELRGAGGMLAGSRLAHPASDPFWRRRAGATRYKNPRNAGLTGVALRTKRGGGVQLDALGKRMTVGGSDVPVDARLVVGEQCFIAGLAGRCTRKGRKLRCRGK